MTKPNRSVDNFRKHLAKVSTVELTNETGSQIVPVLQSGTKGFIVALNGQKKPIIYPDAWRMRVVNEGKLVFLDGINGNIVLTCTLKEYNNGNPVPEFPDFPDEESEYTGNRKKKAA